LDDHPGALYTANTTPAGIDNPDSEVAAEDDPLADFLLDMDDVHIYGEHHSGATHHSDNVGKVAEEAGRSSEDGECEEGEQEDDMARRFSTGTMNSSRKSNMPMTWVTWDSTLTWISISTLIST
jgi:hypothetical protein